MPAGSLRAAPAAVPWPDTSAIAAAATMNRRAATQAATAVRKLISSSQELMVRRSLRRPAGRARTAMIMPPLGTCTGLSRLWL